jgi:hypothetical protein
MDARIIRIGDVPENMQSASFEEAFGDFSDFKGKGRARRQARKLDRIEKKQELVQKKQDLKAVKQSARANKKVGRQQIRMATQAARQEKRLQRQDFRTDRKQKRTDRRAIGQEEEGAYNEEPLNEPVDSGSYNETPQQEYEEQGYAPQSQGGGYVESQGEIGRDEETGGYGSSEEPVYEDEGYSEDEGGYGDEESGYEDEEGYFNGEYDEFSGAFSEMNGTVRRRRPIRDRKRVGGAVTLVKGTPADISSNEIQIQPAMSSFAGSKDGKILGMSKTTFGIAVGVLAIAGIIYAVKKKK